MDPSTPGSTKDNVKHAAECFRYFLRALKMSYTLPAKRPLPRPSAAPESPALLGGFPGPCTRLRGPEAAVHRRDPGDPGDEERGALLRVLPDALGHLRGAELGEGPPAGVHAMVFEWCSPGNVSLRGTQRRFVALRRTREVRAI